MSSDAQNIAVARYRRQLGVAAILVVIVLVVVLTGGDRPAVAAIQQESQPGGRYASNKSRRRYGEFAKEYYSTPQGATTPKWLKTTDPKSGEPKVVEGRKPPEPMTAMPPEPKPVVKRPAPPTLPTCQETRKPVPDAAKLREAEASLRKAFKLDQARSPAEKSEMARGLLETAAASGAKDAELYVMLAKARDLSAQAANAKTVLEAVDAMAAAFEINALDEKTAILTKTQVLGPDAVPWARICLVVSEQAEEAGNYEAAVKLAEWAEALARAAKAPALLDATKDRSKDVRELKWEADRLKGHFKTLEANTDDTEANAAVGKFFCLMKGDWGKGLPMLAKGAEENLKRLAEQELAKPTEAVAQAALGEGWAAQANKEVGKYKAGAKTRAAEWLEKAIPGLTGPVKVSAQKTLASMGSSGATQAQLTLDLGGGVRMEFVYIKPGVFTMGGTEAPKEDWQKDERPPHKVEITKGYYMGKYEVTQEQWEAVMGSNPSRWRGPTLPVEQVTWDDCQNFLIEINKNEKVKNQLKGRVVALPTEAQWEYACRAGTTTRWSFGDNETAMGEYGWHTGNSGGQTHPVGQKKPNAWGLFDMHGNVWEWCQDWWGPYGGEARDPEGPTSGEERCLRGGGWSFYRIHCRSAVRNDAPPTTQHQTHGFRACLR